MIDDIIITAVKEANVGGMGKVKVLDGVRRR